MPDAAFTRLVDAYIDGTATEAEFAELSRRIAADEQAARLFAERTLLDGLTSYELRTSAHRKRGPNPLLFALPKPLRQGAVGLLVAAMLAVAAIVGLRSLGLGSQSVPRSVGPAIALLDGQIDARWSRSSAVGAPSLAAGRYELQAGRARLRYPSGAIAVLAAPATVELTEAETLHLHAGRVAVECRTPSSVGFTVQTPDLRIVDLSTAFRVSAEHDSQRVDVDEGAVSVAVLDDTDAPGTPRDVAAGSAVTLHIAAVRNTAFAPATPDTSIAAFEADHTAHTAIRRGNQSAYTRLLHDSPDLIAWAGAASTDTSIPNFESDPPRLVAGRFGGDPAFDFAVPTDHAAIVIDATPTSATLAAWVRVFPVGKHDDRDHRTLLCTADDTAANPAEGRLEWTIRGETLRLTASADPSGWGLTVAADMPGLADGSWRFLVTTIARDDTGAATVSHYLDGHLIHSQPVGDDLPIVPFGRVSIGARPDYPDDHDRALRGQVDDVMVWSRALSTEEIVTIHRMTKPPR